MLQPFVGAVCEFSGRFGDCCPLHVRCCGLEVVRVGVQQGIDAPPAYRLKDLCLPEDGGKL